MAATQSMINNPPIAREKKKKEPSTIVWLLLAKMEEPYIYKQHALIFHKDSTDKAHDLGY